ncbi:MAG: DEAD/DEAH box helicase [Treponema sp.]|jgi:superfamily II DNA/RNA helicase|nr:DEAD/DEAH box helicase [Treponema sp.]
MDVFDTLGVNPSFIEKLKPRSITKPTAIQNLVIPQLLADKNIIFRSATGTGKTFAYLLPVLQRLCDEGGLRQQSPAALICAPTFELCSQIKAEADFLSSAAASAEPAALLIGSGKPDRQAEDLKKKPVLAVGNPARLLALAKMGKLKFGGLRFLILDEADRLTANECLEETKELLALIERDKRRSDKNLCIAACSATVSAKTRALLGPLFENAEIIESDDHEILRERIEHWALFSEKRRQIQTLRSLLAAIKTKKPHFKALVFTSRSDEAGKILSKLQYHHIAAAGLFGKINKKPVNTEERKEALDSFRQGKIDVLVSTDLAARGLDIPGLTHIITLDVPEDKEVYIHRCGRTGRAGKRGIMITIGDETQLRLLASLEKKLRIMIKPKELAYGRICDPAET